MDTSDTKHASDLFRSNERHLTTFLKADPLAASNLAAGFTHLGVSGHQRQVRPGRPEASPTACVKVWHVGRGPSVLARLPGRAVVGSGGTVQGRNRRNTFSNVLRAGETIGLNAAPQTNPSR